MLTGYVLCKTALLREMPTRYSARGFKWLLELLVTTPGLRIAEWPIVFQDRRGGKSKAGLSELAIFAAPRDSSRRVARPHRPDSFSALGNL